MSKGKPSKLDESDGTETDHVDEHEFLGAGAVGGLYEASDEDLDYGDDSVR